MFSTILIICLFVYFWDKLIIINNWRFRKEKAAGSSTPNSTDIVPVPVTSDLEKGNNAAEKSETEVVVSTSDALKVSYI